jgi:crotonobetainyl-CoA:carnitine CoA-transferase CaiB-like acyl-CoA transferase
MTNSDKNVLAPEGSNLQRQGPLKGFKVLDVSIMAAGPWTAALLGMLGAEVIKVEPPDGDGTRWVEPTQMGMGTNFLCMNVNKKDITLDFKSTEGIEHAKALVAQCDIFVQNFRVGVIERLGLDYESVKKINPNIIYCAISGFGEVGPLSKAGCADYIMQAYSGFARTNGPMGETLEAFRFTGFLDLTTASVAAEAVLAALLDREINGHGQKVEVSMLEAAYEIQATRMAEILGAKECPKPMGSESRGLVPDRAYRCLDKEIFVTAHNEEEWRRFCLAIEQPQLHLDPRFNNNANRVKHRLELDQLLMPLFCARPALWWLRTFERHRIAVGLAHQFETFRYHQQVIENQMIEQLQTDDWGSVCVGGLPWHFSGTPCRITPAPRPDEHTEEVLKGLAQ